MNGKALIDTANFKAGGDENNTRIQAFSNKMEENYKHSRHNKETINDDFIETIESNNVTKSQKSKKAKIKSFCDDFTLETGSSIAQMYAINVNHTKRKERDISNTYYKANKLVHTTEINNNKTHSNIMKSSSIKKRGKVLENVEISEGADKEVLIGDNAKLKFLTTKNNNVGKVLTCKPAMSIIDFDNVAFFTQIDSKFYQFIAGEDKAEWVRVPEDKAILLKAYVADVKAGLRK